MRLFQEAAKNRSLWLSSRNADHEQLRRRIHFALGATNADTVRIVLPPADLIGGMVGEGASDHVSGWIGAGYVYDHLLESAFKPDFVFCLDPWVAMLASRCLIPEARWVLLSSFYSRHSVDRAYWEATDKWLSNHLELANESIPTVPRDLDPNTFTVHKRVHGSWEWKRLTSKGRCLTVRYRTSVLHLRACLAALFRHSVDLSHVALRVATNVSTPELKAFLEVVRSAHPELRVELVPDSQGDLDDQLLMPSDFLERGGGGERRCIDGRLAARILIGEVDPLSEYDRILQALQAGPNDLLSLPEAP